MHFAAWTRDLDGPRQGIHPIVGGPLLAQIASLTYCRQSCCGFPGMPSLRRISILGHVNAALAQDSLKTVSKRTERKIMLWTIAVILLVLWALGLVTSYTMGGVLHVLLVVAIIMILFNLFQGRRSV